MHQFLLHAQLGNFTREDVFTAFYGTRAAPPAVSQTFNAMEESAEARCQREFVHDSQAQLRMQVLKFTCLSGTKVHILTQQRRNGGCRSARLAFKSTALLRLC